jgi:hypothetical protein
MCVERHHLLARGPNDLLLAQRWVLRGRHGTVLLRAWLT